MVSRAYIDLDDQERIIQDVPAAGKLDLDSLIEIYRVLLEPFKKDPIVYALIIQSIIRGHENETRL